jgi:predicted metal-binding membrane protein
MTTAPARLAAASLPRHVETGLVVGLVLVAAAAWAVTGERMGGMDAGPGTDPGGFGFWITAWVVMMAAMMLPSVVPAVTAFAAATVAGERSGAQVRAARVPLFVAGYLLTWGVAGLLGYAFVESVRALDIGFLAWDEAGRYVAGGVILGAALYQLSGPKDACLRHCRHPVAFVLEHWRPGAGGALRMGIDHGGFCVGCCWALMAALFALGVMSIGWMVLVAALIGIEKLLPWRTVANRGIAILLAVLGIAVAFAPGDVPGLTIPGSPEAMEAMGMESHGGAMEDQPMAPRGGSMKN